MTVAPNGDVLLVSQADKETVWVREAGSKSQSVSRLLVADQLDDIVYATQSHGLLYVADAKRNSIYEIHGCNGFRESNGADLRPRELVGPRG
jgi:hypothetical protein